MAIGLTTRKIIKQKTEKNMLRVFKHFGGPRISDTEADQDEGSELSGEHEDSDQKKTLFTF